MMSLSRSNIEFKDPGGGGGGVKREAEESHVFWGKSVGLGSFSDVWEGLVSFPSLSSCSCHYMRGKV